MHVLAIIRAVVLITLFRPSFAAYSMQEWLTEPYGEILSSSALQQLVPAPTNPEKQWAYDRFSLLSGLKRLMAHPQIQHERPQLISEQELHELTTDKYNLGLTYFWGLGGVPRNFSLALDYFLQASEAQDADAMFMVGMIYSTGCLGNEIQRNPAKAQLYYTMAARSGSLEAQLAMGYRKRFGINTRIDYEEAREYYAAAAEVLLEVLEAPYAGEQHFYTTVSKRTFSFGAELNTGLYGRHAYKQQIDKDTRNDISLGPRSSAWHLVETIFPNQYEDLDDAIETLDYRANEEVDASAMYVLARISELGTNLDGPDWRTAVHYATRCLKQNFLAKRAGPIPGLGRIQSMCAEFMAERYLHGNEGVAQNITLARVLYKKAHNLARGAKSRGFPICASCAQGLIMCDYLEAAKNGSLEDVPWNHNIAALDELLLDQVSPPNNNTSSSPFYTRFQEVFDENIVNTDYTIAIYLALHQIQQGDLESAAQTLRKAVSDTFYMAPVAALMLAQLETGERSLRHFVKGVESISHLYSPLEFAHFSYDRGDIESAMLAFMVSSEMGVLSASLNLADLLDVRHSMIGSQNGAQQYFPSLRSLSEWPVPSFVANRTQLAAHYFARAAVQGSADGLAKLWEYGHYYSGYVPEQLNRWYLEVLAKFNFGMAHWKLGTIEHENRGYLQAMDRFKRALVSPEAWLPVKFSQFLSSYHLISDSSSAEGQSLWRRIKEAYKAMAVFEPKVDNDSLHPFMHNCTLDLNAKSEADSRRFVAHRQQPQSMFAKIFSTSTIMILLSLFGLWRAGGL